MAENYDKKPNIPQQPPLMPDDSWSRAYESPERIEKKSEKNTEE